MGIFSRKPKNEIAAAAKKKAKRQARGNGIIGTAAGRVVADAQAEVARNKKQGQK